MRSRLRMLALATFLMAPLPAFACPNCKDGLAQSKDPQAARLAAAYSYSIYLMMAVPVAMLGAGSLAVVRAARNGLLPEL